MTIQQARLQGEAIAGQKLDDKTFAEVLAYTVRKAQLTGHDSQYVPLLLVDEIKDHVQTARFNEERQILKDFERFLLECFSHS